MGKTQYLQMAARDHLLSLLDKGLFEAQVAITGDDAIITVDTVSVHVDAKSKMIHIGGPLPEDLQQYTLGTLQVSSFKPFDFMLVETIVKLLKNNEIPARDALDRLLAAKTQSGWIIRQDFKTGITDVVE